MTNSEHPTIKTLFEQLDTWRHFAGFPLEARVDAFFGLYLPKVIENCLDAGEMNPVVIPQFPLKKSNNNQSDRVDFLAISKNGERAFLVEIKTDLDSRREQQDAYLDKAKKKDLASLLSTFKEVAIASSSRRKYLRLISALADMELLGLSAALKEKIRDCEPRGSTQLIRDIEVICPVSTKMEVLFIQPHKYEKKKHGDFHYIYFDKFADCIEGDGKLGCLFAEYLRRWQTPPAKCPPKGAQT